LDIVLQQSWQMYAVAVFVGFATVMVMRWRRYSRVAAGGDSSLLSLVLNNMTQGVILFDAHERILVCNERYIEKYGLSLCGADGEGDRPDRNADRGRAKLDPCHRRRNSPQYRTHA